MSSGTIDRRQIRTLYQQHGRVLLAYAYTLLPDRASSEDVLHQVFAKLLERKLSIAGPPVHYLFRAVRNAALNYRRDRVREVELSTNGHFLEAPPDMAEMGLALDTALKTLPQEQREVIVLRIWGQMTFDEAAAALEIPVNTAASRYRYGLAKLREQLKPLGKE